MISECTCQGWSVVLAAWLGMKAVYVALASHFLAPYSTNGLVAAVVDFLGAMIAVLA